MRKKILNRYVNHIIICELLLLYNANEYRNSEKLNGKIWNNKRKKACKNDKYYITMYDINYINLIQCLLFQQENVFLRRAVLMMIKAVLIRNMTRTHCALKSTLE